MASVKKIAILQPGYIPWLGFFDLIHRSDVFVILDDVQYTVRDWRSRNRVKTANGIKWLTVPVKAKRARGKLINEVEIDNNQDWRRVHIDTLKSFYKKAACFDEILFLYEHAVNYPATRLIDVDMNIIRDILNYMCLRKNLILSSDISVKGTKDLKLLGICKEMMASHYISGNAAKDYLREAIFIKENITVEWHNYEHPYYNQLWTKELGFISHLSVLDLLFNHGPKSRDILNGKEVIVKPNEITCRNANDLNQ